jgi:hypothetical protein
MKATVTETRLDKGLKQEAHRLSCLQTASRERHDVQMTYESPIHSTLSDPKSFIRFGEGSESPEFLLNIRIRSERNAEMSNIKAPPLLHTS